MNILEYENYQENKTHTTADFPYNTYLCSIPLDFKEVPLHWHDELEIIYIKKGQGLVTVDFSTYEVAEKSILFIRPGQLHSIAQQPGFSMEYENIIFHPDLITSRTEDRSSKEFIQPLMAGTVRVPTHFTPVYPYYEDVASCLDSCDETMKTRPQGYELYIKSTLLRLFFVLENRCRNFGKSSRNTKAIDHMRLVLKHVELHYRDKISISEVAELTGFSESHFMRYFKETMGTSFIEYLKDYRLTMAARLLLGSDSSVLAISEETGFPNLSYFNRCFKEKYKMTPREYRRTS